MVAGFPGALEIEVDRDGHGFVPLAIDTEPDYLDTAALPAPGVSAAWKYRAIYRLDDEQVGSWSDVLMVPVMGVQASALLVHGGARPAPPLCFFLVPKFLSLRRWREMPIISAKEKSLS